MSRKLSVGLCDKSNFSSSSALRPKSGGEEDGTLPFLTVTLKGLVQHGRIRMESDVEST